MEALKENLILASADIKLWKKKYITKQRKKYPNISIEELNRKIINAKRSYFKDRHKEFEEAIVQDIQELHKGGKRASSHN